MDSRNNPIEGNGSLGEMSRSEEDSALDLLRNLQHEQLFAERAPEAISGVQSPGEAPEGEDSDDHTPSSLLGRSSEAKVRSVYSSIDRQQAAETTIQAQTTPTRGEGEPTTQEQQPEVLLAEETECEDGGRTPTRSSWRGLLAFARGRAARRRGSVVDATLQTRDAHLSQQEGQESPQDTEGARSEADSVDHRIVDDLHEKKTSRKMSIWSVMGDGLSQIGWIRNNVPLLLLVVALSGYNIYNEFSMKDKIRQVAALEKKLNDYRSRALFKRADITSSEQLESIEKAVEAENLNLAPSEAPPFIIYVNSKNKEQE